MQGNPQTQAGREGWIATYAIVSRSLVDVRRHASLTGRVLGVVRYEIAELLGGSEHRYSLSVKSWAECRNQEELDGLEAALLERADKVLAKTMGSATKTP